MTLFFMILQKFLFLENSKLLDFSSNTSLSTQSTSTEAPVGILFHHEDVLMANVSYFFNTFLDLLSQ